MSFFVNSGMKLLEDELEKIDNAFYLVGRKDGRTSRKKPIEDLLKAAPDDLPIILLDHSPTDLEKRQPKPSGSAILRSHSQRAAVSREPCGYAVSI